MAVMTFSSPATNHRLNLQKMTSKSPAEKAEALKLMQFEQQAIPLMPKLMRKAMEYTFNNRTEAEDLLQDTFAKAYRYWGSFEQGTNVYGWLKTILKHTSINRSVKESKHQQVSVLDGMADYQLGDEAHSVTARASKSAESEVLEKLASNDVQDAVDNLKPEFRDVVRMAIVDGYSYQEIADILGIKIGTVMSRLHRGKKTLREVLYNYAQDEGYNVDSAAKEAVAREAKKGAKK
jgi:RNA polymerase sigma-70 factor (ECF subfamily)